MATTYEYLIDPFNAFQTRSGSLNTNGILRVFDAATDDRAVTYCDFAGTENPADIRLDDNGRAIVIADDSRAYRVDVYDRYGALQYNVSPVYARGGGGGTLSGIDIVSGDSTINVSSTSAGGVKTFDLSVNGATRQYFIGNGSTLTVAGDDRGYLVPTTAVASNMQLGPNGVYLTGGRVYHVDAWVDVVASPDLGDPGNAERRAFMDLEFGLDGFDGDTLKYRFDNSLPGTATVQVSTDVRPAADLWLKLNFSGYGWAGLGGSDTNLVLTRMAVHSAI